MGDFLTRFLVTWRWTTLYIQSNNFLAQSAHTGWGAAVILGAVQFMPLWIALVAFNGIWVIPKEIVFDAIKQGEDHGSPDWLDVTFYGVGQILACIVLSFKGHL